MVVHGFLPAEASDIAAHSDQSYPKQLRLLKSAEFQAVFKRRCSVADRMLVVYAMPNQLPYSRLGVVVSRKVGNAVVRNRWKRTIREAFRTARDAMPAGLDLVVLPRASAEPHTKTMTQSLRELAVAAHEKLRARPSPGWTIT